MIFASSRPTVDNNTNFNKYSYTDYRNHIQFQILKISQLRVLLCVCHGVRWRDRQREGCSHFTRVCLGCGGGWGRGREGAMEGEKEGERDLLAVLVFSRCWCRFSQYLLLCA
jgi:hypothetical protein